MNNSTYITSIHSKLTIPDLLPVKLEAHRSEIKLPKFVIPSVLETIEHSTSETYVSGNIEMIYLNNKMKVGCMYIPFFTRFIFTGKKDNENSFNLDWCTSLS